VISFIVPAYNEERLIGSVLDSIHLAAAAVGPEYEVIVVDDASSDRTAEIAAEKGAQVVSVHHRQIAASRNSGARIASGDLLVFVDADTWITAEAVQAAAEAVQAGAVGGGCTVVFGGPLPLYARLLVAVLKPVYRIARIASGCFMFATRAAFDAAGGFDETLFGAEEAALSHVLARQGRFVALRESVTTSSRMMRTHRSGEILGIVLRVALLGPRSLSRRDRLGIWYCDRRDDHHEDRAEPGRSMMK